jgi:hypothetical protein
MTGDGAPHPVELLRDQHGIYRIGVSDGFDFEAAAWLCGVERDEHIESSPRPLILRPDWFLDAKPPGAWFLGATAVLQKITGGFRRGPFMRSSQDQLRKFIHHAALNRAGLRWPPPRNDFEPVWWSTDDKQQARNRGIYHGLRQLSLHVINELIGRALEEAADADAVRAARRFAFRHREHIYRAVAHSRRAQQLTETFPVLALAIYSERWQARKYGKPLVEPCDTQTRFQSWNAEAAELSSRKSEAVHLVDRGARLRDVAGVMGIPMALRRIKPGAAHWVTDLFCRHPEFLNFMPDTTPRQRIWLLVVNGAQWVDDEFSKWAARHVPQIRGRTGREVGNFLADIADWASAGTAPDAGREFVTRPFTQSMSLTTATELSADWHEAVANNLANGPDAIFPAPWCPPAKLGDYEILPIEDAATLYREGTAMHHCIGTYSRRVLAGELCIYSVRRNGERAATLALLKHDGSVYLEQIRGACNSEPPMAIITMVRRWLQTQPPLPAQPSEASLPHVLEVRAA